MRAALLAALLGALGLASGCGPLSFPSPASSSPSRPAGATNFPSYPYCERSTETAAWAADCVERCVPPSAMTILCHSGGPPHLYLEDAAAVPAGSFGRVPDAPPWKCTDDTAWRIYAIVWEPHHWGELDDNFVNSWVGTAASDCSKPPPASATRDYFQQHWDRPYFTATEIYPTE